LIVRLRLSNANVSIWQKYGYRLPNSIKLGVMVEVPSLLFEIDELAARADFMSVGSNDLMQFFFAADRENPHDGRPV